MRTWQIAAAVAVVAVGLVLAVTSGSTFVTVIVGACALMALVVGVLAISWRGGPG